MTIVSKRRHLSSSQIIFFGFFAVILLGCLLLMLPCSTQSPGGAPFIDALFTSTSAVCVTGLVLHDTALYWSPFGQAVLLCLIQVGGMGIITIAVFIAILSGKKIGLMQRSTMQEAIAAPQVGGIVRLTGFILRTTLVIELAGAAIMAPVFCRDLGLWRGLWYALFHSVSAFCNAGFDLMGVRAPYSSLVSYSASPVVLLTISLLIVAGGIGFLTWNDLLQHGIHLRRYRMQSKVILVTTAILILLPTLYFYFIEFSREAWSSLAPGERVLAAVFQAITPRTAGFNSVDLTLLSQVGQSILIFLMLIGGSPGSTAGGIKTTTAAVLLALSISVFRRREHAHLFGRRIPDGALKNAATILLLYVLLFFFGALCISALEGLPVLTCLFETASAIGTVGLTLGITPELGTLSHLILIVLMFFGRVGGLTLIFAALSDVRKTAYQLPQEKITVG